MLFIFQNLDLRPHFKHVDKKRLYNRRYAIFRTAERVLI